MIYGVFSDVHSNLEALQAVLAMFARERVESYIFCGDLVGYGPDPNACVERILALPRLSMVAGNHDLAVIGRLGEEGFNPYAKAAVRWTRRHLSSEGTRLIEGLSARLETENFTIVHGTPRGPAEEYMLGAAQFRDGVELVRYWPLFLGHSHMPMLFRFSDPRRENVEALFLDEAPETLHRGVGGGYLPVALNPGSVGQPRDQDARASCAIFDDQTGSFRVVRVPYDIAVVQNKIRAAGLPEYLALRLDYGQ